MKDFIGNPFEQEYENDDEVDEFEIGVGDFLFQNTNPLIIAPPHELEDDEDNEDVLFDTADDDVDDSDFDFFQDNDGYDSDHGNVEFSSDEGVDDIPHYSLRFSIDEDEDTEDDLDCVTFPVSDAPETSTKSASTVSSFTSSSDQELDYEDEDT